MPRVSVIIPTHSRPHLLPRAVESARRAGACVEVIVVDDASRDETAEVCRALEGIKYIRLEHQQGVAGARNIGILNSVGDYLTFLDDDDLRLAGSLDLQAEVLDAAPQAGLIYGQASVADQSGGTSEGCYPQQQPQGEIFWELLKQNFIPCGAVVFRRACLSKVGLLDQSAPGIDDWDLWIRIASRYPVMACAQPVVIWRRSTPGSGQGTSGAAEIVRMSTRQMRKMWLQLPRALSATEASRRDAWRQFSKNVARQMAFETVRALRHRQYSCASKNMFAALRWHPWGCVRAAASSSTIRHLWKRATGMRARAERSKYAVENLPGRSER